MIYTTAGAAGLSSEQTCKSFMQQGSGGGGVEMCSCLCAHHQTVVCTLEYTHIDVITWDGMKQGKPAFAPAQCQETAIQRMFYSFTFIQSYYEQ